MLHAVLDSLLNPWTGAPSHGSVFVLDMEVTIDKDDEDTGSRNVGALGAALAGPRTAAGNRHRPAAADGSGIGAAT